jgi:hypothetical protein
MTSLLATATSSPPAGGAAIGQVVGVSIAAAILTSVLLLVGMGHRNGRYPLLGRLADFAGRVGGLPGWAALPAGLAAGSLITAAFGLYYDVSLHIDNGRDPGPLANPAHYFILFGLFGIFTAGWLAIVLPEGKPSTASIKITRTWHAPVGGVLLMACASFALIGFPLDDVSHRLFGQDVTLWGPTHMMMLGGAAMTLIAIHALLAEARLAVLTGHSAEVAHVPPAIRGVSFKVTAEQVNMIRLISACGGLLIGLSIFQGEFDYGVPQFRFLYEPLLLALASGTALVMARSLAGRGAAFAAVAFYIVVRGVMALIVGGVFGETTPHFPLYIAEALLIEGAAFAISPKVSPYRFAAAGGVLIGTIGTVAEFGWSHVAMPIAWPGHMLPSAILVGVIGGTCGGILGTFLGTTLKLRSGLATDRRVWAATIGAVLVFAATCGVLLPTKQPKNALAQVTLTEVTPAPHRTVQATIRLSPKTVADHPDWLRTIAWQGKDGPLVTDALKRIGEGVYRTTAPIPVYGTWKTAIRLQKGSILATVPVYLPADKAIPVPGVAATHTFTRQFIADKKVLQRERKTDVPSWLWGVAGLIVLLFVTLLLGAIGWGLVRIAGRNDPRADVREPAARDERRPSPAGVLAGRGAG